MTIDTRVRLGGPKSDCIAYLESCCITGNGGHGALIAHEAAHVVQSRCTGNVRDGLRIENCDDADVSEVACVNNGGAGYRVRCVNSMCRQLTASRNGGDGVDQDCDGAADLVEVCATSNGGVGIQVRCDGQLSLSRCSASSNKSAGIGGDCDDTDVDRCVSSSNGGPGFDLTSRGALHLSNSRASRNEGPGARCVCTAGWTGDNCLTGNKGSGLEITAVDGASIVDNLSSGNDGSGILYLGSYGDVSNNRCSSNKGDAISVDGEHNRIASNVVTNNDRSFRLMSGVNPLYENNSGANTNPIFEQVPNDRAPDSPASKATHPFSNIEAP